MIIRLTLRGSTLDHGMQWNLRLQCQRTGELDELTMTWRSTSAKQDIHLEGETNGISYMRRYSNFGT